MNLNALNSRKYFVFLTLFIFYLLIYALFELPYLSFLYASSLDSIFIIDSDGIINNLILIIKNNDFLIYVFFVLKIFFLSLTLSDKWRRLSATCVLTLNIFFLNLNNHTSPELKYINLLFLIIILYPKNFNFKNNPDLKFKFSILFINIIWFIFGLSYFMSGYYKFISPDWFSGVFLSSFAEFNHNFNDSFDFILNFPEFLKFCTYFGMFTELSALPLSLFTRTRWIALINLTLMQLGLLLIADIYQITFGMLIVHIFMFLTLSDLFVQTFRIKT